MLAFCAAALLSSCGGGDSGDSHDDLSGTWFGTMEDGNLNLHTIAIVISGSIVTNVLLDGVSTNEVGVVSHESGQVWSFELNDRGTGAVTAVGGFFVDTSATHAAFADNTLSFGVIQKGATSLGAYALNDIDGAWSGISVETNFNEFFQVASTAICNLINTVDCTVTSPAGTSNVTFGGTFNATFGRWTGTYTGPAVGQSGTVHAFISPDKQFGGAWACDNPIQDWPVDCAFSAWRR